MSGAKDSNSSSFMIVVGFIGSMLAFGVFCMYYDVESPLDILFGFLFNLTVYMTIAIVSLAFVALFSWAMIIIFKDFSSCLETELNIDLRELMADYKAMFVSDWENFTKKVKGQDIEDD